MSAITINGERVISGSITIPFYGSWSADLILASGTETGDAATLVVGDLTLIGTVIRKAAFAGARSLRVVGGAGGWRKELPSRGYSHTYGVLASTVIENAASESGEKISVPVDRSLGTHYARERAPAERVLKLLTGGRWWMAPDGETRLDDRDASPIVTPFTVIAWSGGKGQFEVASESISSWQPGRTFTSATVPMVQTVSSVTIEADNDGKLRLHVLNTQGAVERLRTDFRSLIRAESPSQSYAGVYEYTVAPRLPTDLGLVSTVDCTPTDDRMPALTGVPIFGMGVIAAPLMGAKCRIRFINADPSRPECIAIDGMTEHTMTAEATVLLVYNVFATMCLANLGPWIGVTMQPLLTPAILAALAAQVIPAPPGLIAQIAAAAAQTATITAGTAPANAIGPFAAAIPGIDTKVLDVSGQFPGLGVPNG